MSLQGPSTSGLYAPPYQHWMIQLWVNELNFKEYEYNSGVNSTECNLKKIKNLLQFLIRKHMWDCEVWVYSLIQDWMLGADANSDF